MSAITIEGQLVHYEALGRGKPVLFVHGWLGSWRYWMSGMQALADTNRTYAVDLWGFGDSAQCRRYTVDDYVMLIEKFVDALGISELSLVGHSLGAVVILEYARQNPDQVRRLMPICLPLTPASVSRRSLTNDSLLTKMMWWQQPLIPAEVQAEIDKTDKAAITASLESVAALDVGEQLALLGQANEPPVLAVSGEKDTIIDSRDLLALSGRWPNLRAIALPDTHHFPMLENTVKFHRLLKDFLAIGDDLSDLALKEEWRRRMR